ncbi:hypothetical protein [Loktanella fryxellensis]|uniref:hypothetical protein n=1 Tax=Loktanella fryxellensis TaxID=245187 RepID=UPI0015A6971A|nr:hypothetical protein [Loktanella fryxellensis]
MILTIYGVGWFTLNIPMMALLIGLRGMIIAMVMTRLCLHRVEQRDGPHVPIA